MIVENGQTATKPKNPESNRHDDRRGSCERVSSATVDMNGKRVLRQSDFSKKEKHLERPVELLPSNKLAVKIASEPGSCLTLKIVCAEGNRTPLADAGLDQTLAVGAVAQLDGSGSSDADGDALTFLWSLDQRPAGSASALSNPAIFNPTLSIDRPGSYLLSLVVNDGLADSAPDAVRIDTANSAPVADAGADSSARVNDTVALDGSRSFDADGDLLRFDWAFLSQPTGSAASLSDPTAVSPSFTLDRFGDYEIALTVSDGLVESAPDTVRVSTLNSPPVAHAGPDRAGHVGAIVALDGSTSTDVDGDPLAYRWSLVERPAESLAVLSDPTAVQPTFVLDWPGTYIAQLIVNDGTLDSPADTLTVITENTRPVADAGPDQGAHVRDTVALDGTGSRDVDGDPLAYAWSLTAVPAGSAAALAAPDSANPTFRIDLPGTYVAQLVVNDGALDSAPDTVTVATENVRPVADAGPDRNAFVNETVVLDGSGSRDADGDPLSFQWSLLGVPDGSAAALADAQTASPSFVPDRPGLYVAQLIASDGELQSDPDTAAVEVTVPNRPPVIASAPVTAATADAPYSYDVEATDPDAGDVLTYSLTAAPAGMTIDAATGLIGWTPAAEQFGDHPVAVRVQDSGGLADTQSFTVAVAAPPPPPNRAPVITSTPVTGATVGQPYAYDVAATDPDAGDVLAYSLSTAPTGMTIDPVTGLIGWTPTAEQVGDRAVIVRVQDPGGLSAEQPFTVGVARDNRPPVAVDDAYRMQLGETLVIAGLASPVSVAGTLAQANPAAAAQASASYGQLPLAFEANAGQTDPRVRFLSRGQGYTLFLAPDEAVLALNRPQAGSSSRSLRQGEAVPIENNAATEEARVLRLKLLGANVEPQGTGLDALPGKSNYFIGSDPSSWRTSVPTYAKVRFDQVYPGIDLVYYGNQRQLEYDFVVAPGADPSQILLAVEGADQVAIDAAGNLVLRTPDGEIRQHKPLVYQEIDGERRLLDGRYVLLSEQTAGWAAPTPETATEPQTIGDAQAEANAGAQQTLALAYVGFEVAEYDRNRALVIDPVLEYATYLGGTSGDSPRGIAVDPSGQTYVAGLTRSADFPVVGGAQGAHAGGDMDVFVAKLSADGGALLYSTFIGGTGIDVAEDIAIDEAGNSYITGQVYSADFPVVDAFQPAHGGGNDAYVLKLDPSGTRIVYSSYLGHAGRDFGTSIAMDSMGAVYVAGVTNSPAFPTVAPLQAAYGGGPYWGDAFVAKVSSDGSRLVYSTFLGGAQDEMGYGIALDSAQSAFVGGWTSSSDFPTANALQPNHGGRTAHVCGTATCGGDAFVAKLSPNGDAFAYSTFLGGVDDDAAYAIAVDVTGNTYLTGQTHSANFPILNAIQSSISTGFDVFVAKLNPTGSALIYSTYLGGTGTDSQNVEEGHGIAADPAGNAYVEGLTDSRDFPLVEPIQAAYGGGRWDTFLAKIPPGGEALSFSSYLGGNERDWGYALAVDRCGDMYPAVDALSSNMPTLSPLQASFAGASGDYGDAYLAKLRFDNVTDLALAKSDTPDPVVAGNALRYTLTVSNLCNKAATGVRVTDTLPPQVTLVSATPTQGTCTETAGTVSCDLGGLAGLASAEVTLVATVNAGQTGILTNHASVRADQDDPDPRNNSATATTNADTAGGVLANDYDPDGDPIAAIQVAGPAHGAVTLSPNGTFTYTPATGFSGTDTFTYKANDGALDSNIATVTITVNAINQPPVITSSPVAAATVRASYNYDVDATDPDAGDTLIYALDTSPAGMTIDPASGLIAWTPTTEQVGDHGVTVRVQDPGGLAATQVFTVTVAALPPPANQPPVIASTPVSGATAGQAYAYDVEATDPDLGDVLTYALVTAPTGMTIDPASGLIGWTPTVAQAGDHSVTVRVTDTGGLFADQSFTLAVSTVANQAPRIEDADIAPWWTRLVTTGTPPTPRENYVGGSNAYDWIDDRLIFFGGSESYSETPPHLADVWILENATASRGAPNWLQLSPSGDAPQGRILHAAAYDPTANRLIVYGGATGQPGTILSDTWVLTNANGLGSTPEWIRLADGDARVGHAIGYDPVSNRLIVFGGNSGPTGSDRNDVRILLDANGIGSPSWITLAPQGTPPSPRGNATAAVYDALSNRLIVFGGRTTNSQMFNDVWVLTNANGLGGSAEWINLSPIGEAPSPRVAHSLAFDQNSSRLLVFGGAVSEGGTYVGSHESWVLKNANGLGGPAEWVRLSVGADLPLPRADVWVGYLGATNRMVVSSGSSGLQDPGLLNDAWVLSNASGLCTANQPCRFQVTASDPDAGDTLSYSLDTAPASMTIDPASGAIDWTPTPADTGDNAVTVRVTDSGGLSATHTFTATVAPVAVPNVVGLAPEWAESFIAAADLTVGTITSQGGAITLNFDSLPSRQGWTYWALNNPTLEADVFSVSGGTLFQNSLGTGFQGQGANQYNFYDIVEKRLPMQVALRARVLEEDGDVAGNSYGFAFGEHRGTKSMSNGLGTAQIMDQRWPAARLPYDNTSFHRYRLEARPGIGSRLIIDDALVWTAPDVTNVFRNLLFLGDATGGTNARAEVTAYSFTQPRVVGQNPPAGTLVRAKSAEDLTIQDGPATQTVPSVIGVTQADAAAAISAAELTGGALSSEFSDTVPSGAVVSQRPLPGIHVPKQHQVDLVISLGPEAGSCAVPPAGLVAWWAGDGTAQDYIAANHGRALNGATSTSGLVGGALSFDGEDDVVRVPATPTLNFGGAFTVEFWFKPAITFDPVESQGGVHYFFAKGQYYSGGVIFYGINTANNDGRIEVNMPVPRPFSLRDTWEASSWYHMAVVYTGNSYQIFVDGRPEGISVSNPLSILDNPADVTLGWDGVLQHTQFPGELDEMSLYNRALSDAEIQSIYDAGAAGKCKAGIIVADADRDRTESIGSVVVLDGSASRDLVGGALSYEWSLLARPEGSFSDLDDPAGVTPSFVPDLEGEYLFQLVVRSGGRVAHPDTVRITASAGTGNQPPSISSTPGTAAHVGDVYTYAVEATDPDTGDVLTYSLQTPPAGMTIDATTGLIAWTPNAVQVGDLPVTVRVTDSGGLFAEQSFTVAVTATPPANRAPSFTSTPPTIATAGVAYSYDGNATDPDGDTLTYSLTAAPAGMMIDPANGLIQWTPTLAQVGSHNVSVRVEDPAGAWASQSFTIAVSAISVPDVVGQTESDARSALVAAGLTVGAVTQAASETVPLGRVITQDPAAGTPAAALQGVSLVVSSGPAAGVLVPDVVGLTRAEAEAALRAAQLAPGTLTKVNSETVPVDRVVSQVPAAAALVSAGSAVSLVLSLGRAEIAVPTVLGLTEPAAEDTLTGASLAVGVVSERDNRIVIQTDALPSEQGFYYWLSGNTRTETEAFSVSGGVLTQNTLGVGLSGSFTGNKNAYDTPIQRNQPFVMTLRARVLQSEGDQSVDAFGFCFGTANGDEQFLFGLNSLGIQESSGSFLAGAIDTTQFHTYRLVATPYVGYQLFVDSRLYATGQALANPITWPYMIFGDCSGLSNAHAEITEFWFRQGPGLVIEQDPVTGTLVGTQAPVDLVLAAELPLVAVPTVLGQPQAQAETTLLAAGFLIGTVGTASSGTVPAGAIVGQTPAGGASVAAESAVDLIVSSGPAPVTVPDVVGQTQAEAEAALTAAGLAVGAVTQTPSATVPAGRVISQSPAAGASVSVGTAVSLAVSSGPAPASVPNLVGLTQAAATAALQQAGLVLGSVTTQSSPTVPAGQVMSQTPAAGAQVASGTAVDLVVSSGSGPDPVPGLASIRVQPAPALILAGQTQSFSATGILGDGTSLSLAGRVRWESASPAVATVDANGLATALSAGTATIRATNGTVVGSAALTVVVGVPNATLPSAVIAAPADGATVTEPTPVIGTAADLELLKYVLELAPVGTADFATIAEGTAPVTNGTLGTLDPTLLINDLYTLRLTVTDRGANVARTEIQVQVAREQKVGNFTLAFQDVSTPMACMPLTVTRVYDSRDKGRGDFGVGWRLDVQTLRLRESGTMGEGWAIDLVNRPGPFGIQIPTYVLYDTAAHKVSLTLPDGQVEEFDLTPTPSESQYNPIGAVSLVYTPRPGTLGSLAPVVAETFAPSGDTGSVELIDSDADTLDPPAYRYTTPEGNVYLIDKVAGVQQVQCINGQTLTFGPGGIAHSGGKDLDFTRDGAGRITAIADPAGNLHRYAYDTNGDLSSHTDSEANATAFRYDYRHGLLEVIDPRGVRAVRNEYDEAGRLVSTTDAAGNAVTFAHDLAARTETVTDRLGNTTVYAYDDKGNVLRETDALGNLTEHSYDAFGNEETRTDPLRRVTIMTYDSRRNLRTETDPLGRVTDYTYTALNAVRTIADPLGRVTTNDYDARGNLLRTTDPLNGVTAYTYDTGGVVIANAGLLSARTDALEGVTQYSYHENGNLHRETDALNNVTEYSYDANGNRRTETRTRTLPGGGTESLVTRFEYDGNNRLTQTTHPDGSVTRTEYNAIGKQSRTIDALNRETLYLYDDAGRLIRTTYPDGTSESSTYDAEGRRLTSTDRAARVTHYTYDALGRLTRTDYPDNTYTVTAYDAAGQVERTTDALGHVTRYEYDAAGRRIRVVDALEQETRFEYDAVGNQIAVIDANNHRVEFAYDRNNRRVRTLHPDGTEDRVGYDLLGRQTSKTDQAGVTTQYRYDALGQLIGVIDALNQETTYGYDAQGNQVSQTDANGNTTRFGYDAMGRRTSRTLPLGMTETMRYDLAGNLESKTDFNGRTTTYVYDSLNRLTERRPDAATGEPVVRFAYHPSGQRARMEDASGVTTYGYDGRDRLIEKASPQGTLSYDYDAAGNLLSIASNHPGGAEMTYAYDALNRLASVTDAENRVTSYAYDGAGNLESYLYPNGVAHRYTYNALNRLTDLTVASGATPIARYTYTLGPSGNRTAVDELSGRRAAYGYDALYRLTSETVTGDPGGVNGTVDYDYDPVGNRLERSSTLAPVPPQTFSYDDNDRIEVETYDDNGNTLVTTEGRTLGYDSDNRLVSADGGVSFVYDGDGNRVARTAGGVTTGFLVDTLNPTGYSQVLEEIENGAVVRRYTYGLDLVSQEQASGVSFYGYDGHGSVRELMDRAGHITDEYAYEGFGVPLSASGSGFNNYTYAGEQIESSVGAYYLRARYYDAENGRFSSVDDYAGRYSDVLTSHGYLYASNDPIGHIDPSGHYTVSVLVATAIVLDAILPNSAYGGWLSTKSSAKTIDLNFTVLNGALDNSAQDISESNAIFGVAGVVVRARRQQHIGQLESRSILGNDNKLLLSSYGISSEMHALFKENRTTNRITVYYVPDTVGSGFWDLPCGEFVPIGRFALIPGSRSIIVNTSCSHPLILAHELGHALGLAHATGRHDLGNLMYPYVQGLGPNLNSAQLSLLRINLELHRY